MTPARLLLLAWVAACASAPQPTLDELSSDLRIESLPRHARVEVSGADVGATPYTLHVERGPQYSVMVGLPGFESRHLDGTSDTLLKTRTVELVLVPQGYAAEAPRGDDVQGLTAIAELLNRNKDWGHAAEFWQRLILLDTRNARAHRGLGSAYAKLGQDEQAIREYEQYLLLAPDAPDAARVQRAIDGKRGGIELPSAEPQ